jgi:hypothetical protein
MSKKAGRNDPCPCGSGKKYKSCHWGQEQPQSDTSRKSLFGRIHGSTGSSAVKKTFAAKVLKSGGAQDLVEKTFAESLDQARHEELPPSPPQELPEQELPKDYKPWKPPTNE